MSAMTVCRAHILIILINLLTLSSTVFTQSTCHYDASVPLNIPIRNVTLAGQASRRGVALSMGTPPQESAFEVVWFANNTFIYDGSATCPSDTTPIQCTGLHGGSFNEGMSSTWSRAVGQDASGAAQEHPFVDTTTDFWGNDLLQLNSSVTLKKFPFAVTRTKQWDLNAMGLGQNSTILNALYSAGIITSRSWSFFWGLIGADATSQMDGSLVLGGYDAAKIIGDNFTDHQYISQGCITSLLVTVTDILMNLPDGSKKSIIGSSSGAALRMCIQPEVPLITLPGDMYSAFSDYAGGTFIGRSRGINGYGMLYAAQNVYAGSLTFSFSSGLKITIPNSQLVLPYMTINDQGTTISNSSIREIMLNKLQGINANDMPILGQTFLTSAYLMVNQDASTFTLWQNQPTLNQSLVAIGPPKACTAPVNTSATITGSSSSNISTFPASAVNRISGGAIAGLCVGAIAFSALVLGLALWLRRRSLQRKDSGRADGPTNPTMSGLDKSEVPRDGYPPQELPARSTMQQAPQLYPSEMAA